MESEATPDMGDESLDRSLRGMAGEIGLLYRLSNTIRRASKESQNLRAAKLFHIRDDEGNDVGPMLRDFFARYLYERFPDVVEGVRERLASTMLLRRKRILYRRSRYGETPIKTRKTITQPEVRLPVASNQITAGRQRAEAADVDALANPQPAKTTIKSLAPTATTFAADAYKGGSTPSVISATKTVALGNHEALVFPTAPTGRIRQKYKQLKRKRKDEHKAFLRSLPSYSLYEEYHGKPPLNPDALSKLHQEISKADAELRVALKVDWDNCAKTISEFTCPFCLYALPSLYLIDEKKWK